MEYLKWIPELVLEWLPALFALLFGIGVVSGARYLLLNRFAPPPGQGQMARQLLITALVGIFVIGFILSLPIGDAPRGQLLSLVGLLVTAAIALSSTTLVGNAMAGLMLRSIRNFRAGDFIIVNEHRGRVSEKGWLRTEIQTERRNLTTLPNLYLVTNPVSVIRSSGTFISATVSLGYDVPREKVHECLLRAAEQADLEDPFVFVVELGDFSIIYQAAGFLEDVKYLLSAESALRESMLDSLHHAGIEIVSPSFMNQRQLEKSQLFIPKTSHAKKDRTSSPEETRPEELMFDKADKAESEAKIEQQLKAVIDEIDKLKKSESNESGKEQDEAQIEELKQKKAALEQTIRERAERKEAESKTDES
jgi:small-conductance mechanosensitive channel